MVFAEVMDSIVTAYFNFLYTFPSELRNGVEIIVLGFLIAGIAFFIWEFYSSISKRDILSLNLKQYNSSDNPTLTKLFAILLYILEYLLIIPALLLVWFGVLSLVISLLATSISTFQILTITAAMLIAIRVLAYYRHEISEDLAKLFPFITLSVFLIADNEVDAASFSSKIAEIPSLLDTLLIFFLSVFAVEVILRMLYSATVLVSGSDEKD